MAMAHTALGVMPAACLMALPGAMTDIKNAMQPTVTTLANGMILFLRQMAKIRNIREISKLSNAVTKFPPPIMIFNNKIIGRYSFPPSGQGVFCKLYLQA